MHGVRGTNARCSRYQCTVFEVPNGNRKVDFFFVFNHLPDYRFAPNPILILYNLGPVHTSAVAMRSAPKGAHKLCFRRGGRPPLRFADPPDEDYNSDALWFLAKAPCPVHRPCSCSGVKDMQLRCAFGILDPFRALREPEIRRRDEERPLAPN